MLTRGTNRGRSASVARAAVSPGSRYPEAHAGTGDPGGRRGRPSRSEVRVSDYRDRWIECNAAGLRIRGYYFPWGAKRIPYRSIRSLSRVELGALTGRGRVWGTANPRYWASLDPRRPRKRVGLVLDLGRFVRPLITPDDPDAVEACIRAHTALPPTGKATPRII